MLKSHGILGVLLAVGLTLAACDAPANETSGEAAASNKTAAGSALPSLDGAPASSDGFEGEMEAGMPGSMEEGSPADEMVTEEEIPHSDVPPPSRDVFVDTQCEFEEWVGKAVDEDALKATGRRYRILKPGAMMTMDHNPQRINVEHDDKMIATRVWCG